VAVHDRLGVAGGARGIDDPERVLEGHRHRRGRRAGEFGPVVPALGEAEEAGHHQPVLKAGQAARDALDLGAAVDRLAGQRVAVLRDQYLGFDLAEAVQHRRRPHVGRGLRPDRAEAGDGEKGDHRFQRVGQDRHHAIPLPDAQRPEAAGLACHLGGKLAPAQHPAAECLGAADQRRRVGPTGGVAEHLRGEVAARAGEPFGARHGAAAEHGGVPGDVKPRELDDRRPEGVEIADRPAPQGVVVGEIESLFVCQPADEIGHPGCRRALGRRGPEDGSCLGHAVLPDRPFGGAKRARDQVRVW